MIDSLGSGFLGINLHSADEIFYHNEVLPGTIKMLNYTLFSANHPALICLMENKHFGAFMPPAGGHDHSNIPGMQEPAE